MRLPVAIVACCAFASGGLAQESGAGLRVETRPGGATAIFASPTEAQAACTGAGGGFGLESGRFICVNPRTPLRSTRASVAPALTAGPEGDGMAAGTGVDSLTLRPGENASFVIAEGNNHQLLRRVAPAAPGAITVTYMFADGRARLTATSRTGFMLRFTLLADPDGNGGFSPMGEVALPGDGSPVTRDWPRSLGTISIGSFVRR